MRTINLQPLIDRLAGPTGTITTFSAVAQRGKAAAFRTEGPVSIAPGEITAQHDGTAWATPPQLPPLPAGMHWRITVMIGGHHLGRHVTLPAGTGPVDFADLIDVDPATGIPSPDRLTQWTATLQRVTELAAATELDRLNALHHATRAIGAAVDARTARTAAEAAQGAAEYAAGITGPALESTALAAAIDAVMGSGGQLHHGAGAPNFVPGSRPGDYYLDTTTGELHQLETGDAS